MTDNNTIRNEEQSIPDSAEPPRISDLGSVGDLTLAGSGVGKDRTQKGRSGGF